ncbi:unnamed protein product [Musa acuminata subsp. malaccensis]|uniref:(wild Malaysian banana) hypothetical protein n=1 Tax=Musa acuminata subsp. malaccensis TaxID=214687 RepID=A0A804KJI6_MUSAM|nr:unnamed protein product [Musa acuminata subsp. malaccensis]
MTLHLHPYVSTMTPTVAHDTNRNPLTNYSHILYI